MQLGHPSPRRLPLPPPKANTLSSLTSGAVSLLDRDGDFAFSLAGTPGGSFYCDAGLLSLFLARPLTRPLLPSTPSASSVDRGFLFRYGITRVFEL